ncbi:hypothetical protein HWV62_16226 [Athelia sp. TMB]|nr:hypothetical protein HWV62_16226 [Athelia sp. TMB]
MKVCSLLVTLLSAVSVKSAVLRDETFPNATTALEHANGLNTARESANSFSCNNMIVSIDGPVHYGWLSIEYGYSRGIYCDYRSGGYLYRSGGQIDVHNDCRVSFDLIYTGSGNAEQHGQCKLQVASTFGNYKDYYLAIAANHAYLGLYSSGYTVPCDVVLTGTNEGTISLFKSSKVGALAYYPSDFRVTDHICDAAKYIHGGVEVAPVFKFTCNN